MSVMEDLRAKSADELKEHVAGLKKEMFNLRFQLATGEAGNTSRFREVRQEIARTRTVLTEQKQNTTNTKQKKTSAA